MAFLRFLGFTLVRAGQGFWRNKMMSLAATATVILMLVLLSGLVIVLGGLNSGLAYIESKVGVTARLVDGLDEAAVNQLVADVRAIPGVATVEYVSPEEAMRRLEQAYPADLRRLASFETGDSLDLGDKLHDLLALQPAQRRALGEAARRVAVERWSWAGVAARLLEPFQPS